jgi:hypothetical protein
MKSFFATMLLAIALSALGQEQEQGMMMPPPPELKALWFLKGEWDADLNMFEPGKKTPTPFKGSVTTADALNGMWIETRHDSNMGGMPMKGLQMTSYDPGKKKFMAFWFDSMGPGGLELWGSLKGQTVVLTSKRVEIPGMPGRHAFRATTSLKGPGRLLFRLEMNSGKGWGTMIEGTMTRK